MSGAPLLDLARWYDPIFAGVLTGIREAATRIAPANKGMKILDVGCGTGMQLVDYQDSGGELFGIDLSPQMLRVANSNLKGNAGLVNGDALQLPYLNASFDLVISALFLHQLDDKYRSIMLEEIIRVLKSEGQILVIDFHPAGRRTIMGKLTYLAISILEYFAGKEHFRNSRTFLFRGGIPEITAGSRLILRKTVVVGNGNLGIYLLRLD